ncbi:MAG: T9SS type A sorting domain-containing protein [Aureispira sp.]|nr:T9SS type A sorting domain-containing protein [Aureispira sp.]
MKQNFTWRCLVFSGLLFLAQIGTAQVNWNLTSSGSLSLTTCYEQDTFLVEFTNVSGSPFVTPQLTINFPPGVFYRPGTFNELTSFNLQEFDISDLNAPIFSMNDIPSVSGTVQFNIAIRANCDALTFVEGSGVLANQYTLNHSTGSHTSAPSSAYSLLAPSLSFSSVTPASLTGAVGSIHSQSVVITNGGNGATDSVFLALNPTSGIQYSSPNIGTLNATNDTIWFVNDALGTDSLLIAGEDLTVVYKITISDCNNLSTDLNTGWGCDGLSCKISTFPIAANVIPGTPNLAIERTINHNNWCFGDGPQSQTCMLINNGTGTATKIFFNNGGINTAIYHAPIDTGSVYFTIGSTGTQQQILNTDLTVLEQDTIPFDSWRAQCHGSSRRYYTNFRYTFPDSITLEVGDTLFINWDVNYCRPNLSNTCYSGTYHFYNRPSSSYKDPCGNGSFVTNTTPTYLIMNPRFRLYEVPSSIESDSTENFDFYFSGMYFNNNEPGGYIEFQFILPNGLVFDNNPGDILYRGLFPDATIVSGDTVTARYNAPILETLTRAIRIKLRGDCAANGGVGGTQDIGINLNYVPNPSCTDFTSFRLACGTATTFLVGCPSPCNAGFLIDYGNIQRINFGSPDNDNNKVRDLSGSLDSNKIKFNRFLFGDTMEVVLNGSVITDGANPDFEHAYVSINASSNFSAIDSADITIFDNNTGLQYNCRVEATGSGPEYIFDANSVCGLPPGFKFEQDDSIVFRGLFELTTNLGFSQSVAPFLGSIYMSDSLNPTVDSLKFGCDGLPGNFIIVGYRAIINFDNALNNVYSCQSPAMSVKIISSMGAQSSRWFPYEYRLPIIPDSFIITVPNGYTWDFSSVRDLVNNNTSPTGWPSEAISPDIIRNNGTEWVFDIKQYLAIYGGTKEVLSEECQIQLAYRPKGSCEVVPLTPQTGTIAMYTFDTLTNTNAAEIGSGHRMRLFPPDLSIVPITPTVVATQDTVEWLIRVQNIANNSDADSTFLGIESIAGSIQIIDIFDTTNNVTVTPSSKGIYKLGAILQADDSYYRIRAVQNSCVADSLLLKVGWNCNGYPDTITDYPCTLQQEYLKIQTPPSEIQLLVTGPTDSVDMCEVFTYEIELTSAQPSNVYDLATIVDLTSGLNFESGSVQIEHPVNSGFVVVADPTVSGSQLTFDINAYSSKINTEGLIGTANADSTNERKIKLRFDLSTDCDFTSGTNFPISVEAERPCGDTIPTLNFNVTPIVIKGTGDAPYFTQMRTNIDTVASCGSASTHNYEVYIRNLGGGETRSSDEIVIQFPTDVSFLSYNPVAAGQINAPSTQPTQAVVAGMNQLTWAMPASIPVGDSVLFRFQIDVNAMPTFCGSYPSPTFTSFNTDLTCVADASTCSSMAINGSTSSEIVVDRPNLGITINTYNNNISGAQNTVLLNATISNSGKDVALGDETTVEFFCDTDHSGGYTTGDVLLGEYQTTLAIPNGGSVTFDWNQIINNTSCDPALGDSIIATFRTVPDNGDQQCACAFGQEVRFLPVQLVSFEGKEEDCAVELQWQSTEEENLSYFEVQRSANGFEFEALRQLTATGSGSVYRFMDKALKHSSNYYRLRTVDTDGLQQFSKVIQVQSSCFEQLQQLNFKLYPIPVRDQLQLSLVAEGLDSEELNIKILDVLGQVVYDKSVILKRGMQQQQIDVQLLPAGSYWIQLGAGTWRQQRKFIKID